MRPIFKTVIVMVAFIVFAGAETLFGGDDPAGPASDKVRKVGRATGQGASLDQKPKTPPFSILKSRGKIVYNPEATKVAGEVPKGRFLSLFWHMLPDLRVCHRPKSEESVKKQAVLRMVFSPSGKPEQAELVSTDITDPTLKTCVPKMAKKWRIPATSDGKPVTVEYTLVFE